MIKVIIIGSGNLAHHLINAFANSEDIDLIQVFSRQKESIAHIYQTTEIITALNDLAQADLYIIAVSDGAIAKVSSQLFFTNRLVVHTSGTCPIEDLDQKNRIGVFYPLQTFTKNSKIDFESVPICIESQFNKDQKLLWKVASAISKKPIILEHKQRKALHLSAIFANNFVNHMYQISEQICNQHDVSFDLLKSLIAETANKITNISPEEAQTGPAKRNDNKTIEAHLEMLTTENQIKIYKLLTKSIQSDGKKL